MYVNKINNDNKYFTQVSEILTYSKSKINEIKANESNPRIIKEAKFKKLVKSITCR